MQWFYKGNGKRSITGALIRLLIYLEIISYKKKSIFFPQEYGMESFSEDEDEPTEETKTNNTDNSNSELNEIELNLLRQQVENEVKFSEETSSERKHKIDKSVNFNIQNYMASITQQTHDTNDDQIDEFEDAIDGSDLHIDVSSPDTIAMSSNSKDNGNSAAAAIDSLHLNGQSDDDLPSDDELADLDPKSREYRFKMVEKILSDARSHRSYSTSASTIAPSVVTERIKKTLDVKEKREMRKRCVAKGEASAVTRVRNENRDECKQYAGWDF